MKVVFLSFFLLCSLILLVNGATQLTGCNTTDFCINIQTLLVCSGDTAAPDDTLRWRIRDNNNNLFQSATYDEGQTAVGEASRINFINNSFSAILTSSAGPIRSNLTFNPNEVLNNYTIQCTVDTTLSCRIMIPGIPPRSEINEFNVTSTYVNISWPISTHPCFEEYRLLTTSPNNPNTIEQIFDRSITSILLPISQLNDTEYSYTLYVTDTGRRYMEPQLTRMLTYNVPLSVANLTLTQTDYPTDTNETVNITVSWNEQQSSRPSATQYNVKYNISNEAQIILTNVTSQTLSGFSVGLVYTVSVEAVNPLGTGPTTSATITILAAPPPPEIPSTSTSVSYLTSVIRSTPGMTSSSSMSPSNSPTQESSRLGPGAIAGIVIAIIGLIGVLAILVIAIVCYVKKKNKDKDSSVTPSPPQTFEAINYAQVEHSAKSSSSKRQAPPKPASSHSHEAVEYSAIQNSAASHNAPPPPEDTEYADLDHSASTSSGRQQRSKDTSNQVEYSRMRPS